MDLLSAGTRIGTVSMSLTKVTSVPIVKCFPWAAKRGRHCPWKHKTSDTHSFFPSFLLLSRCNRNSFAWRLHPKSREGKGMSWVLLWVRMRSQTNGFFFHAHGHCHHTIPRFLCYLQDSLAMENPKVNKEQGIDQMSVPKGIHSWNHFLSSHYWIRNFPTFAILNRRRQQRIGKLFLIQQMTVNSRNAM